MWCLLPPLRETICAPERTHEPTNPRRDIFKKRCTDLLHLKSIISKLQSKFQLFTSVYLATEPLSKVLWNKQANKQTCDNKNNQRIQEKRTWWPCELTPDKQNKKQTSKQINNHEFDNGNYKILTEERSRPPCSGQQINKHSQRVGTEHDKWRRKSPGLRVAGPKPSTPAPPPPLTPLALLTDVGSEKHGG